MGSQSYKKARTRRTPRPLRPPRPPRPRVALLADAVAEEQFRAENTTGAPSSVETVAEALHALGYEPVAVRFEGDPAAFLDQLIAGRFRLAFNLCEALSGQASQEHLPAAAVELLGIPMTGARSATLALCLRKDRTNACLRARGVPIPDWLVVQASDATLEWPHFPAIVKPAAEDGSLDVSADCVVRDRAQLDAVLERGFQKHRDMLIQRFVPGREFNVAIVAGELLPHSEIDFRGLPDGLPPIVTYNAKWAYGSTEDVGTVPVCPAPIPAGLADRLSRLGAEVWKAMEATGYMRVDIRADRRGNPFVLDVNPNPDLSPGAGLARQAAAAGWSYADLVGRIVEDALAREDQLASRRRTRLPLARSRERRRKAVDA